MKLPAKILAAADGLHSVDAKVVDTSDYQLVWDGLLYDDAGRTEGAAAGQLIDSVSQGIELARAACSLRGTFLVVLYDKAKKCSL